MWFAACLTPSVVFYSYHNVLRVILALRACESELLRAEDSFALLVPPVQRMPQPVLANTVCVTSCVQFAVIAIASACPTKFCARTAHGPPTNPLRTPIRTPKESLGGIPVPPMSSHLSPFAALPVPSIRPGGFLLAWRGCTCKSSQAKSHARMVCRFCTP